MWHIPLVTDVTNQCLNPAHLLQVSSRGNHHFLALACFTQRHCIQSQYETGSSMHAYMCATLATKNISLVTYFFLRRFLPPSALFRRGCLTTCRASAFCVLKDDLWPVLDPLTTPLVALHSCRAWALSFLSMCCPALALQPADALSELGPAMPACPRFWYSITAARHAHL
jgi:hypothetical protein